MSKKILIKKGKIIDPANNIDMIGDILTEGSFIKDIGKNITDKEAEIIEAHGMIVAPGLVDMHVHLREPGQENKEKISSGTMAAAAGGFTSIACMPNTIPPIDTRGILELVKNITEREGKVNVYPIAAATKNREGSELSEMGELAKAGAVAFSDDGNPITNAMVMRRCLEYASMFNKIIIVHEEDPHLVASGAMNEGVVATKLGLPGIPSCSEDVMVARDIILAKQFGRVHFAHISTKGSIKLIREAKKDGVPVTVEATPHHLVLTEESLQSYSTYFKMSPPLRCEEDRKALEKAVIDGTIDCIATDHAPHTRDDKNIEFNFAANGVIGLETALPIMATYFVHKGKIDWKKLIEIMSVNPARILGIPKGTLTVGKIADIVIIDPNLEKIVDPTTFKSKSRNTPFKGMKLKGWAKYTICKGEVVFSS